MHAQTPEINGIRMFIRAPRDSSDPTDSYFYLNPDKNFAYGRMSGLPFTGNRTGRGASEHREVIQYRAKRPGNVAPNVDAAELADASGDSDSSDDDAISDVSRTDDDVIVDEVSDSTVDADHESDEEIPTKCDDENAPPEKEDEKEPVSSTEGEDEKEASSSTEEDNEKKERFSSTA